MIAPRGHDRFGMIPATGTLFNRTRTSRSIAGRLAREGKLHLLPLYALLRTSSLAREGMENSGSYRFADHVYRGRPGGRLVIGPLVDALLLRLRAARSMRCRHRHARAQILAAARRRARDRPFRVLSVPCGVARELVEAEVTLRVSDPALHARAAFYGLDLDPRPLRLSRRLTCGGTRFRFLRGDAFDPTAYPPNLDVVVSTGLGEFLTDEELIRFYRICRGPLRADGVLVTSATRRDPLSDWLLRELAELRARYREPEHLVRILHAAGFDEVRARLDPVGLQILIVARRSPGTQTLYRGGDR